MANYIEYSSIPIGTSIKDSTHIEHMYKKKLNMELLKQNGGFVFTLPSDCCPGGCILWKYGEKKCYCGTLNIIYNHDINYDAITIHSTEPAYSLIIDGVLNEQDITESYGNTMYCDEDDDFLL